MQMQFCLALSAALLAAPPAPTIGSKPPPPAQQNAAALALRQTVARAEFDKMPLQDFTEWVQRTGHANVVVRWTILEKAGIARDTPVSLKLRDVPLGRVLHEALAVCSLPKKPLAFQVSGNVLIISTRANLDQLQITRTYEVNDLVVVVPSFQGTQPGYQGAGSNNPRGSSPDTIIRAPNDPREKDSLWGADERIRDLVLAIQNTVEPDTWKAHGGQGTIAYFRGKLIIRNNARVHELLQSGLIGK